jgi:hypothetical protein
MWFVVAGFCELQLWVLLGLLPATVGGPLAWTWAGLAALTLVSGLVALRRHPDAGALLLALVLPVTLIPPFVFGRKDLPLLAEPLVQALAGVTLAVGLTAIVLARREGLNPPARAPELGTMPGPRTRRPFLDTRIAALLLAAIYLALPIRALIDPSLVSAALGAHDPIRAKETLLLVSWAAAALITLAAVLPALAGRAIGEGSGRATWTATVAGGLLAAVWGVLLWVGT